MNEFLKNLYHGYIKARVNEEYVFNNPNAMVMGENMLNGYYFLLLDDWNISFSQVYLIVENCKTPCCIKVTTKEPNPHSYCTFRKSVLKNFVPSRAFNTLINNGLYKDFTKAISPMDNLTSVHRLNMCLYTDIKDLEVHHNNKIKTNNYIANLTPVEEKLHDYLDMLPEPEFSALTNKLHFEFKQSLCKQRRDSVANRDEVVLDILLLLWKGFSPIEIEKKLNGRVHKSKIYEIKNYYFYLDEFLEYLHNGFVKEVSTFDGIYDYQWTNMWVFYTSRSGFNVDYYYFTEYLAERLEIEYKNRLYIRDDAYY